MSLLRKPRRGVVTALVAVCLTAVGLVAAPGAQARPAPRWGHSASLGTTTVTTAPGIAATFLGAKILPLPVPGTRVGISLSHGLAVSYGFPITGNTVNLAAGTGDITHSGGINFVSRSASLEIGKFDIDLAAGKIYAAQVNYAPAWIPVLDVNLSGVKITHNGGSTFIRGVGLALDPAAAGALNSTFGINLPADGSLTFGSATICLNG